MNNYTFTLTFDNEIHVVNANLLKVGVYAKGAAFVTEKENEQQFYRTKLNGKLRFQRESFYLINNAPFETEFILTVTEGTIEVFKGVFFKTDCSFDLDKVTLTVQPEPQDNYKALLEGMDREIDLLKLRPLATKINYKKQPLIQIYLTGSELIGNYLGGVYWETPVTPTTSETELTDTFKFTKGYDKIIVTGSGEGLVEDVSGIYDGNTRVREDGIYTIIQDTVIASFYHIRRNSDGQNVFFGGAVGDNPNDLFGFPQHANYNRTFSDVNDITVQVRAFRVTAYARVLTDVETGNTALPETDIVSDLGYKYVLMLNTANFHLSVLAQTESERYGQFITDSTYNKGNFFPAYIHPTEGKTYPVLRSTWTEYAIWFYYDDTIRNLQETLGVDIKDVTTYKIENVLQVLLKEIDPTLSHQGNASFSNFLYGFVNPLSGVAEPRLTMTPNTNITIGGYDQPASKAIVTLREVLEMLKGVYSLYPFLEGTNLRLEHEKYFENGGSYTAAIVGTDLTQIIEPKTEKKRGFGTSKWKFDKFQMPERIRHKWQNDVSEPFEGFDIVMRSKFVEKGNIKKVSIAKFTSDIDYMQALPFEIAKEGFAIIGIPSLGVLNVPFFTITQDINNTWKAQNGQLSFIYLHDKFHRHRLPASQVTINEQDTTASSTKRNKLQEINFPSDSAVSPMQLVTTALGSGKIDKLDRNLSSKFVKATLRHDTES